MYKPTPNSRITTQSIKYLLLVSLVTMLILSLNVHAANKGRVIDEASGKPMEGVYVMAMWNASVASVVDAKSVCYHFAITQTDKDGNYELPSRSWNVWPFYYDRYISHEYYSPGYSSSPNNNTRDISVWSLRRSVVSAEQRIKGLLHSRYENCTSEGERKEKLLPLYKAQYEEAKKIATTGEEKKLVEDMKMSLYRTEFGYAAFIKKMSGE